MKIEQNVEVDAPLDQVWALVTDVPRIAPCMPGAQLTNVVDEATYEGTISVKLGPINLSYKGTAVLDEVDKATNTARLTASGKDVRGGGTARAGVVMQLESLSASSTAMAVTADVVLTGKVASFGRGAIQDVSAKLFGQFAQCLRDTLEEESRAGVPAVAEAKASVGAPPAGAEAEAVATAAAPGEPAEAGARAGADGQVAEATAGQAGAGAPLPSSGTGATQPPAPPAGTTAPKPRAAEPIQGLGLVLTAIGGLFKAWWAILITFFRRLFGRS